MRIIKEGAIKPKKEEQGQCPNCDTIFAFTSDDVICNWAGGSQDNMVTCPFCRRVQIVGNLKIV